MKRYEKLLRAVSRYMIFFGMVAFVITCCMMLFVSTLAATMEIELTGDNLSEAAKLTFLNVLLLSLIYSVFDFIRRKITVDRPVRQITAAAECMIAGDFSVRIPDCINYSFLILSYRIPHVGRFGSDESFNEIIDCFNRMAEELSG